MNVLVVVPHITLFRPEGHLHRLRGFIDLFNEDRLSILAPEGADTSVMNEVSHLKSVYYFKEPQFCGVKIPYFLNFNSEFKSKLSSIVHDDAIDIVVFDFPWGGGALKSRCAARKIYFAQGFEKEFSVNTLRHFKLDFPPFRFVFRQIIGFLESSACRCCDLVVTISLKDSESFKYEYGLPDSKVFYLPQPTERYFPEQEKQKLREKFGLPSDSFLVVFHGSHSHYPNREAINILRSTVAPAVAQGNSDIAFIIFGTGQPVYSSENVRSLGYVASLKELLCACDCAIVPLFSSFGAQMKLLDYLSCGLPVVSTRSGSRGYELRDEVDAVITDDTPAALVEALLRLVKDKKLQERLTLNSHEYIRIKLNPLELKRTFFEKLKTTFQNSDS